MFITILAIFSFGSVVLCLTVCNDYSEFARGFRCAMYLIILFLAISYKSNTEIYHKIFELLMKR